jgi:putative peptidoglycan lipid II flippase
MVKFAHRFGLLVGLSAAGYVLSFCSQLVISYYFGTSPALDGYWAGLALVNLLCFYLHPLREALVPAIHREGLAGPADAGRMLSAGFLFLGGLLLGSSVILLVGTSKLAALMVPGGDHRVLEAIGLIMPWLIPYMCLLAFSETLNSVLLGLDRAVSQSVGKLVASLVLLGILVACGAGMGIPALMLAQVTSMAVGTAICAVAVRELTLRPVRNVVEVLRLGEVWPLFGSLLGNYLLAQLYVVAERAAMIHLSGGLVSAYQYSTSLVNMIVTLLAYPLANLLWPRFLASGAAHDLTQAGVVAARATAVLFLALTIGCTFVWLHADQIVFLLFSRGAFGGDSTALTASALRATIFAAVPISMMAVLGRLLISFGHGRSQVQIGLSITCVGLMVIGCAVLWKNVALVQWHWFVANAVGLAVAWSIYSRRFHLSWHVLIRGCLWGILVMSAVAAAALITPRLELGGGKFQVGAALAIEGVLFLVIAGTIAWFCGAVRPLLAVLRWAV